LRSTGLLNFVPDNLHMDSDGRLFTAGMVIEDPVCGNATGPAKVDFEKVMICPRPFVAGAVDPKTMEYTDLATSAAIPQFSNVTMALVVEDEIWIGTFAGDRVAYQALGGAD
jgi:hypothetical protein